MDITTPASDDGKDAEIARLRAELAAARDGAAPAPTVPTFGERITDLRSKLEPNTRRTFDTHYDRLLDGVGPVCDQTCEPCVTDPGVLCRCECRACMVSRITIAAHRILPADKETCTKELAEDLKIVAGRIAIKHGIVHNRRRAERGLAAKRATGIGAQETAVSATRKLYDFVGLKKNKAMKVAKPSRRGGRRRALADFELLELAEVTATGGNDPELDTLLFDLGIETGARRVGPVKLTIGALYPGEQLVDIDDKGNSEDAQPVSSDLMDRLLAHARNRGGAHCVLGRGGRPDAPVLYFADGTPLTERRYDALHLRWQKTLPWGNEIGVSFHYLRHTMADVLKSSFGPHYAQRFLRHADDSVTDVYGKVTTPQLAGAMSQLLGYEHPLVTGRDARRAEVLRRHGIDPTA